MAVTITDLRCKSCGFPLKMPGGGAIKKVVCEACGVENIIEGAEKNLEILSKENIMGGLQFELTDPKIHKAIVDTLCKSECPPLDIFNEVTVSKVRKIIVPAYWFDNTTGTGTAQYEKAVMREQSEIRGSGQNMRSVTVQKKEWFPMSLAVSDTNDFIVSGNKQYTEPLHMLYLNKQNPEIVDIELLNYPAEANALSYDQPDPVAFNQFVKPVMEKLIEAKALTMLSNVEMQNFQIVGTSIQKGEVRRISIGIYEVGIEYKGVEYTLYLSNNGDNSAYNGVPVDQERKNMLAQKLHAINTFSSPLKTLFGGLAIAGIIIGLIMFVPGIKASSVGKIVIGILLLIGGIVSAIFYFMKRKVFLAQKAAMQAEYNGIVAQFDQVKQSFTANQVALRGVLNNQSGNPEAF